MEEREGFTEKEDHDVVPARVDSASAGGKEVDTYAQDDCAED